jgi:chaperonin GroES
MNNSGLTPLGRAVLLEPFKVERKTKGGIVLPDSVVQRDELAEQKARVVEVGPHAWRGETPWAKVGDLIVFSKWAGHACVGPLDKKQYRVVNDNDIFMRFTESKEESYE